jgi:hypothetical protein
MWRAISYQPGLPIRRVNPPFRVLDVCAKSALICEFRTLREPRKPDGPRTRRPERSGPVHSLAPSTAAHAAGGRSWRGAQVAQRPPDAPVPGGRCHGPPVSPRLIMRPVGAGALVEWLGAGTAPRGSLYLPRDRAAGCLSSALWLTMGVPGEPPCRRPSGGRQGGLTTSRRLTLGSMPRRSRLAGASSCPIQGMGQHSSGP